MRLADKALPNKISKPRSDRNPQSNREAHAIWCAFFISRANIWNADPRHAGTGERWFE